MYFVKLKYTMYQLIFCVLLVLVNVYYIDVFALEKEDKEIRRSIVIIGAGPSGLAATKRSLENGFNPTVFEQGDEIGGTWTYTNETDKNKYGLKIHSPMYKELRTNVPYQIMEFPGVSYPNDTTPFPGQSEVLTYLNSYADHFKLKRYIKFNHLVVRVIPIENDKWEVIVKDLQNDKYITNIYDVILVCNGHFFKPYIPAIEGANQFKGKVIHSHAYRFSEPFRGENVLIIGAANSGVDLLIHVSKVANHITLSENRKLNDTIARREKRRKGLPPQTILKSNVKRITSDGAEFVDGTKQSFTAIIYATGYNYSYPFLSVDCGIHVKENFVQPLFKHIFNIERPTMAFIGMTPEYARVFDLQVRFAMKFLSGEKLLPSKEEMLNDTQVYNQIHWSQGYPKYKTHVLYLNGTEHRNYLKQLSELADIENIPPVFDNILFDDIIIGLIEHPTLFRKYKYTINDNSSFTKERYQD